VDTLVILLVVLVIVVIWRGPKTLPQIGQMLGRGVKAARDEARGIRTGEDEPGEPGEPTQK
jgi:Sec-independent protein translocase protein TatA